MRVETPASRRTDPDTSHQAELELTRTGTRAGQQQIVHERVLLRHGLTASEHAERPDCPLDRYQFQRRLSDLTGVHVRRGEARQCTVTGRKAITWWPR